MERVDNAERVMKPRIRICQHPNNVMATIHFDKNCDPNYNQHIFDWMHNNKVNIVLDVGEQKFYRLKNGVFDRWKAGEQTVRDIFKMAKMK